MGHFRRNGTQDLNVYTKDSSNIYQLERPRGRTIDVEKIVKPNQYNWPLGKIKEIAAQKRK